MKASAIIGRYLVELSTDDETTQCHISYKDAGHNYSASLASLYDTRTMETTSGLEHKPHSDTIERIYDWAAVRGYID